MFKWLRLWWKARILYRSSDGVQRYYAAKALGELGDRRAVEPLIEALGDDDSRVRGAAAEALGNRGDPRAVKPLIKALGDSESLVSKAAANALAALGEPAWQGMVRGDDRDVDRLGASGDPRAAVPLVRAFARARSLGYRHQDQASRAARGLVALGAVEPLIQALGDSDPDVRCAAAEALGELGDPRAVEPLTQALGDSDSDVRCAAAEALGELGDPRAFEPLIQALADKAPDACCAAVEALGSLGDPRAFEPLIQALGDGDEWVRPAAAKALGALGDARAVGLLVQVLRDRDLRVRSDAAEALGKLGDARAVEPLTHALARGGEWVRRCAAEALGKLGDARAVEPLIQALGDGEGHVRRAAANALAALGEPAWEELVRGKDEDLARLGASGDPRALEPLIKALGHWRSSVAAAEALGKLGDRRAVEPLIQALGARDGGVRRAAANALAALGEPAWEELVRGEDEDLARLGASGDPRALEPLFRILEYESGWSLRRAAAEALLAFAQRSPSCLRRRWAHIRQLVTEPHQDARSSAWSGGTGGSSDCHYDSHTDTGIGMQWPEEPPAEHGGDHVVFACPNPACKARLKLSVELAGRRARCPRCHQVMLVPGSPGTSGGGHTDF